MPSEHSRSSSGSSVTSPIPTINLQLAPASNGNGQTISLANSTIRSSHPELLEIFNARTGQNNRDRSTSKDRDKSPSRGKSPSRNNNPLGEKRGKSPSGRSKSPSGENLLDRPKNQDRSRSRSPGPKSPRSPGGSNRESPRPKSPRLSHSRGNSDVLQRSSSQDARIGLTSKTLQPWIAPSGNSNGSSSSRSSNRLSLPPNFADISIATIRENNERWAKLNLGTISDKDNKNSIGGFSKSSVLRNSTMTRPKLSVSVETLNNSFAGGSPLQRTPSGQGHRSAGGSNSSPLLAPSIRLTRSRSYNSAMDDVHRSSAFIKESPHPLQHSWTMYYDSKPATTPGPKTPTLKLSYEENLQTIGTFNTVETFCRYFNWVKKPSQLDLNTNFHIFKDKIKPMWEDPANANGGKWVISMRNPQLLDRCWTWLVYSLVGEELDEGDDICGAVMSRRIRGDRIAVWVRDKDNVAVINGIGRRLLRILDLQNEKGIGMDFQFNEDALKSGTSYNNRVYLSLESLKQELENAEKAKKDAEEKTVESEANDKGSENTENTENTPHIITEDVDIDEDANVEHTADHNSDADENENENENEDEHTPSDDNCEQETTDCTPHDQSD